MNEDNLLRREVGMMKLDALIAAREHVAAEPLPIPVKEMLGRYEKLYTGAISAALLRAEEIHANEKRIFGWVAEGQTVQQITEKGGYF